ncbi:MAG: aspartyl protease family protein [Chitinophagaceae bacterium]|nr:aspartyl protease family protein [Chitinophagaceae bacterium]
MKRIYNCLILSFLLLPGLPALSQKNVVGTPARIVTQFAFEQFSGGIAVIRARLNNYPDSLNFILDTGSGGISLDSTTVVELNIPTKPSDRTIRGIAGVRRVNFLYNATLHLPGLSVDSLDFHINDYEILSSVYGVKIDGIIGLSFFSRYIVNINYDDFLITVYSKGEFKYKKGGYILKPILTSIPIVQSRFRDRAKFDSRFYFDSGAGLCFLLSENFAHDSLVISPKKKMFLTQAEGLGGKTEMSVTTVKEVRIGPYKFKNVPTYIFEDAYNITAYPYLAGLIGNDLLRRFNVTLNYAKKEIHLIPNTHFYSPFDYAYTGLGIYTVEGKIKVEDVIADSPAEKAGFKVGDIVVSVGTDFSNNIQTYKNILQSSTQKHKVIINRSDELIILTLKPDSIL